MAQTLTPEIKEELCSVVEREIASHQSREITDFTTNAELARHFGISRRSVLKILEGVNPDNRHYRYLRLRESSSRKGAEKTRKLSQEDKQALCELVEEEVRKHMTGDITQLTNNEELATYFRLSPTTTGMVLREMDSSLRHYRFTQLQKQNSEKGVKISRKLSEEDKKILCQLVEEEITYYLNGKISELTTNNKLADLVGVHSDTIRLALQAIPHDLRKYRYSELLELSIRKGIKLQTKLREEDKLALYELVEEEIRQHRAGEISRFSSTKYLSELCGVSQGTIIYLLRNLKPQSRSYRTFALRRATGKGVKTMGKGIFGRHPETGESYHAIGGRACSKVVPYERRVDIARKSLQKASQKPNNLENIFINALREVGLFAEDRDVAETGQIYYPGHNGNRWYRRLGDGRWKFPDFKVKGQQRVIEIYGHYHHSKEFCELNQRPQYDYIPDLLVQEYAKVGIGCKVYLEDEIRNPLRLAEIIQEIKSWAG